MSTSDFSSFPLREGGTVPRELVTPLAEALQRGHGASVNMIALRGGISVFELLLLLPPRDGLTVEQHRRRVCDFTLAQALNEITKEVAAFHKRREEEAEAAMLKAMEEGAA